MERVEKAGGCYWGYQGGSRAGFRLMLCRKDLGRPTGIMWCWVVEEGERQERVVRNRLCKELEKEILLRYLSSQAVWLSVKWLPQSYFLWEKNKWIQLLALYLTSWKQLDPLPYPFYRKQTTLKCAWCIFNKSHMVLSMTIGVMFKISLLLIFEWMNDSWTNV